MIETANDNGAFDIIAIINDGSDRTIDITQGPLGQAIPLRRYTHGAQVDEPLSVETFDAAGNFEDAYTYHTDHLGSVRFLTDGTGQVVNVYDYDSYGRVSAELEAITQPFRYTAREWDAATELYHYRARQYDPTTGRFLQEDPIGFAAGDLNIYRYVKNLPNRLTDPTGLSPSISQSIFKGRAMAAAGRLGLSIAPRMNCLFSIADQALSLSVEHRIDTSDIKDLFKNCTLKTKGRRVSSRNSNHANSITSTKMNHVYVIYGFGRGKENTVTKVGISAGPHTGRGPAQKNSGEGIFYIARNLSRSQALALECVIVLALTYSGQTLKPASGGGDNSPCAKAGRKVFQ